MKKVLIAMSGGVDSSVCAALLRDQGYDCTGVYLNFWFEKCESKECKIKQNKCCSTESLEDARKVAKILKIPFYVIDVSAEFKKIVVDYFLKTFAKGQTPNPCVVCNEGIKFGLLMKTMRELSADYLATGHYATVAKKGSSFELLSARDREKDQSYFLYRLGQKKLSRILFPLGKFLKTEVYKIAKRKKLGEVAQKPQSQGICFFPEATPQNFLMRNLGARYFKKGKIKSTDGRVIGIHKGLPCYTIGQRKRLGIGGISGEKEASPWFVVDLDKKSNTVYVGKKKDLYKSEFNCRDLSFISGFAPKMPVKIKIKVRYRAQPVSAILKVENGVGRIKCQKPVAAVSCGQSAVFYKGKKVLGGGIISN